MRKLALDSRLIYYVYILFDWLGVPRYVGKGADDRWLRHERRSDNKNWLKNEFIEQTWIALGEVPKIKVQENLNEVDAFSLEITLIKVIGRLDKGKGPLLNITDGGDGPSGYKHTSITKLILAERHASRNKVEFGAKISEALNNRTQEEKDEHYRKVANSLTREERSLIRKRILENTAPETIHEWGLRANRLQTTESRRLAALKGHSKLSYDDRSRMVRESMSVEELTERALKGWATRKLRGNTSSGKGARWITNGKISKRIKPDQQLPAGWYHGRAIN